MKERYSVSLRIQSESGKMQTRITPNTDTFHAVVTYCTSQLRHEYGTNRVLKHINPLTTSKAQNILQIKHVRHVAGAIESPNHW